MSNSANIKLLLTTPLYPPQVGGPATRAFLLENRLPDFGFEVSLVKFGDVLTFPKIVRHFVFFLQILIKGFRSDVIVAQDPVSTGLPALLASKLLRKKYIVFIVGDYAWEQGVQRFGVTDALDDFSLQYKKYSFFVRTLKNIQTYVAGRAHRIIVPSLYLQKIVSNWGLPKDAISVIHNSFDAPKFFETKEEARNILNISGKVIVSAGRLVPWKGFEILIRKVMPKVVEIFSDAKLYILGDGPDKHTLEKAISDSGAKEHVILLGKKDQVELFRFVRASDVFVLNTSYEGMSHQLLEVMALGTPIVASDIAPNAEVIDNGVSGVLSPLNDEQAFAEGVIHILSDQKRGGELAEAGKQKILDFSEDKMLGEFVSLVRTIIQK